MRFENTTVYGKEAVTALILASSKTVQKRRYLLRRIFLYTMGLICLLSGLLLLLIFSSLGISDQVICLLALLMGVLGLTEAIFMRRLAAWKSRRMLVKGGKESVFRFDEEGLHSENPGVERSVYEYSAFSTLCETKAYYVLLLDTHYGMIISKTGFTQGNPAEFPAFLQEKTGKPIQYIK